MGRPGLLAMLVLLVGGGGLLFWRCEGTPPEVVAPEELIVGREAREVPLAFSDVRSGLRALQVSVQQGEGDPEPLEERSFAGEILRGAAAPRETAELSVTFDARALGLDEGPATLRVSARDWSWASFFSGNETALAIPVTVDLSPPRVLVETGLSYVGRGGAGAVVYSIDEGAVRDGVLVGDHFYAGHPFPGKALGEESQPRGGRRLALYAVARDAPESPRIVAFAEDAAGNRTEATWPARFRERSFEDTVIKLSDGFLEGKVRSLADELDVRADAPLEVFRQINERVRAENEAKIRAVVADSGSERHWRGPFRQMRNSAVTSRFAEHRTYLYRGEEVSQAIHFGYDLASTAGAPIAASAAGRVLHAEPLGIYGNCVIVDHGLGLTSLYAHLSSITVQEGDPVEQGQELGRSGATGLAGGDHLHFAILVGDTYVDPKEWWDPKWVREKIESQLE